MTPVETQEGPVLIEPSSPAWQPNPIVIESPTVGQAVTSPAAVRGRVDRTPFENTLAVRIYDHQGNLIGQDPIHVEGEPGQPGVFDGAIDFADFSGPGRIEVIDTSPANGLVTGYAAADIYLGSDTPPETRPSEQVLAARQIVIDSPMNGAQVAGSFPVFGRVTVSPFENNLGYHVYDEASQRIAASNLIVQAELGQPGTFQGEIQIPDGHQGPILVEIFEASAADGFVLARGVLSVLVAPGS